MANYIFRVLIASRLSGYFPVESFSGRMRARKKERDLISPRERKSERERLYVCVREREREEEILCAREREKEFVRTIKWGSVRDRGRDK